MGGKKIVSIETCVRTGERATSPRTLEACRRSGIDPDELLPKSVPEFLHHTRSGLNAGKFTLVEKEAAVLRQQHYEQSRQAKLDCVRRERDAILRAEDNSAQAPRSPPASLKPSSGATVAWSPLPQTARRTKSAGPSTWRSGAVASADHEDTENSGENPASGGFTDSTMLQLEEKRLAKMKLRQQREIQGVIDMETKMAKIQQENARRTADEARRREAFEKDLRAKRAALVATKHERELAKKQQEDREAVQRRLRLKEHAEKERLAHEEQARRLQERQQEALQRELERSAKADEFKRQTEALLKHQEDVVAANRQRMLEKERQVLVKVEMANKRRHQEAVERREKAQARIQHATAQNQLSLERKKSELESKQASASERAKEIQRKTLLELKERALQQRKDDEVRLKRLDAANEARAKEVAKLLMKRQEAEAKLQVCALERERARQLQTVEKTLSTEERQQTVERIKRREEYARQQLLARIADEDERSRTLKAKKHAIMHARQQVALDAMLRKHRITHAMDQLRASNKWDKIEETLGVDADVDYGSRTPRAAQSHAPGGLFAGS